MATAPSFANLERLSEPFEENGKEYILVKDYISKNTILSRAISKSRYYDFYFVIDDKKYIIEMDGIFESS